MRDDVEGHPVMHVLLAYFHRRLGVWIHLDVAGDGAPLVERSDCLAFNVKAVVFLAASGIDDRFVAVELGRSVLLVHDRLRVLL